MLSRRRLSRRTLAAFSWHKCVSSFSGEIAIDWLLAHEPGAHLHLCHVTKTKKSLVFGKQPKPIEIVQIIGSMKIFIS